MLMEVGLSYLNLDALSLKSFFPLGRPVTAILCICRRRKEGREANWCLVSRRVPLFGCNCPIPSAFCASHWLNSRARPLPLVWSVGFFPCPLTQAPNPRYITYIVRHERAKVTETQRNPARGRPPSQALLRQSLAALLPCTMTFDFSPPLAIGCCLFLWTLGSLGSYRKPFSTFEPANIHIAVTAALLFNQLASEPSIDRPLLFAVGPHAKVRIGMGV